MSVKGLPLSADRPDHLKLCRTYVSRRARGGGRAVLEGVGLDAATIAACFRDNPLDDEAAVQEGLTRWMKGLSTQPPTWGVLIKAMEYAGIAQQHIQGLMVTLSLHGAYAFVLVCCMCVCLCMRYVCICCTVLLACCLTVVYLHTA